MNKTCINYKKNFSIRKNSFFEDLNIPLRQIFKLLLCYISRMPRYSITNFYNYDRKIVERIINKIVKRIPDPDFSSNKMGGIGKIIQVDETMLNYKLKRHRSRAPENKTDALCIIEYGNEIKRVFVCVIDNKLELTIVPILCSQVAANSIIWTDEHGAYANLKIYLKIMARLSTSTSS